jgi:hypothetical protein
MSIHSLNAVLPSTVPNLIWTWTDVSAFPSFILGIVNSTFYDDRNILFITLEIYLEADFNLF